MNIGLFNGRICLAPKEKKKRHFARICCYIEASFVLVKVADNIKSAQILSKVKSFI